MQCHLEVCFSRRWLLYCEGKKQVALLAKLNMVTGHKYAYEATSYDYDYDYEWQEEATVQQCTNYFKLRGGRNILLSSFPFLLLLPWFFLPLLASLLSLFPFYRNSEMAADEEKSGDERKESGRVEGENSAPV